MVNLGRLTRHALGRPKAGRRVMPQSLARRNRVTGHRLMAAWTDRCRTLARPRGHLDTLLVGTCSGHAGRRIPASLES